ncbi:MAG: hypothetical protein ACR2NB_07540 [Solirubrobacteraceae bacterium]
MTGDPATRAAKGALEVLLLPGRIPLRALSSLADLAGMVDGHLAQLLRAVRALQPPLERIDEKMVVLEESLGGRLDALGVDLGARVSGVEERVVALLPLLERMAGDLEETSDLLPDPSDGPLARLRHTFTSG